MNQTNTEINASVNVPFTETPTKNDIMIYDNCFQNISGRSYNYATPSSGCSCGGKFISKDSSSKPYGFLNPISNEESRQIVDNIPVYTKNTKSKDSTETMVPCRSNYSFNSFTNSKKKENFEKFSSPEVEKKMEHKTSIIYDLVIIVLIIVILYFGCKTMKKLFCECGNESMIMFGGSPDSEENEDKDGDFVEINSDDVVNEI